MDLEQYTQTIATITHLFGTLPPDVRKVVGGWIFADASEKPVLHLARVTIPATRRYNRKSKPLGRAIPRQG